MAETTITLSISDRAFDMVLVGTLRELKVKTFAFVSCSRDCMLPIIPALYEEMELGTTDGGAVVRLGREGASITLAEPDANPILRVTLRPNPIPDAYAAYLSAHPDDLVAIVREIVTQAARGDARAIAKIVSQIAP